MVDYITGTEKQKAQMLNASQSPTLAAAYDDPDIQKKYAFATELRDAVGQAKARPVSPVYPQISQAIYKNVNEALSGQVSPEEALKTAKDRDAAGAGDVLIGHG